MLKKVIVLSTLLLPILSNHLKAARIVKPAIYAMEYEEHSLARSTDYFVNQGHRSTIAKALVSERLALQTFEERMFIGEQRLTSLQSLLRKHGCEVSFWSRGDRGIDNIFVVENPMIGGPIRSWIDQRFSPVFVESHYSSGCPPQLPSIQDPCQQFSFYSWNADIDSRDPQPNRLGLKFPHMNQLIVNIPLTDRTEFLSQFSWLQDQLNHADYYRMVSVLSPEGRLKIFHVVEE